MLLKIVLEAKTCPGARCAPAERLRVKALTPDHQASHRDTILALLAACHAEINSGETCHGLVAMALKLEDFYIHMFGVRPDLPDRPAIVLDRGEGQSDCPFCHLSHAD